MGGQAMTEMTDGYFDGRDPNSPEPSANRSARYRHGFQMGRDDLRKRPSDTAANNRLKAAAAEQEDESR
jgi:hypothetical protein